MQIMSISPIQFFKRTHSIEGTNINYNSFNQFSTKFKTQPNTDTISFKRAMQTVQSPFVHDPRELDLHCACCDSLMLKNSTVQNFMDKKIYYPAHIALEKIKHEQNFRIKEQPNYIQKAYSFIKNEANKNKDLNMEELIQTEKVCLYKRNTPKEQTTAINQLRHMCREVAHNIDYMVTELDKLHPDFQNTEETVFQELKKYAKIYPTETISNIFNKPQIMSHYLKKLQDKQNAKLNKIQPLIQQLSPQYAKRVKKAYEMSYNIFNNESSEILHKRQRVLDLFARALEPMPFKTATDDIVGNYIMKKLESLPDSKNDANAFIVKYAPRGSNNFIEVLVKRLRNTKEHVKPQHRKGDNGESDKKNYIYLCGKCNHERMTQKYDEFIEKHPLMPMNTQKQINEICDYINQGILNDYDTWPNDIKLPLGTESEGLIVIDTSKLDVKKAKENRTIKLEKYIEQQKQLKEQPDTLMTGPYRRHGKKKHITAYK